MIEQECVRIRTRHILSLFLSSSLFICLALMSVDAFAQESTCARVKIEIAQELTLERQAFDAHMRIHNGMDGVRLENVGVEVLFFDWDGRAVRASSDPDDSGARFFIRLSSLERIDRVDGLGTVAPKASADIHWLIIPAPGASRGIETGTLYAVGASLSYTLGGERHVTAVTPDAIFVKPLPEMALDYFLPAEVFGDDPFTPEVEPSVPFSLGVRVANHGTGLARSLSIESAQPRIVSNHQGLPIGFAITESEVNGAPAAKSLLVALGDLPPESCRAARWTLVCPLSGRFVELKADFSHAHELGGRLTSLIASVDTHLLVRDVLLDLAGRDAVRDFLARDGDVLRLYESEGLDSPVLDRSPATSLQFVGQTGSQTAYTLSMPPTDGLLLTRVDDPTFGAKRLKEVIRSDGKRIRPENAWLTRERVDAQTVRHTVNLFDGSTPGIYRVLFEDPGLEPRPPILEAIPEQRGVEGQTLTFPVLSADPDGAIPALSASPLPALAVFTDLGDGTGRFQWTPAVGQAGRYTIAVSASDATFTATQRVLITVCSSGDSDCDGMDDAWEMLHFATLHRDGSGDLDGDGVSDFAEFWRGTDPTRSNAPTAPVILSPPGHTEVTVLRPELTVRNGTDPDPGDTVTHRFELCGEPGMVNRIAEAEGLIGPGGTTTWTLPARLEENRHYFWRVRATDGRNASEWVYGSFRVNTANDAPAPCSVSSPQDGSEVDTLAPRLQVTNGSDPDGDGLTYGFEVYGDDTLTTLIALGPNVPEGPDGTTTWTVSPPLSNHRAYAWRATVTDTHGARAATPLATFAVNVGNTAPSSPEPLSPVPGIELDVLDVELVCLDGTDEDGDSLSYSFEIDTVPTFDGPGLARSGTLPEGHGMTRWSPPVLRDNTVYFWRVRAFDGWAASPWSQGSFMTNTANDGPSTPTVKNPGDGAWVQTLTPTLQLNPAEDLDRDALTYRFALALDKAMQELLAWGETTFPEWTVPVELPDNTRVFWRGQARDEHGSESPWTAVASFFVNNNGVDDPPGMAFETPSRDVVTRGDPVWITWRDADPDSNATITLTCGPDRSPPGETLIAAGIREDVDGSAGGFLWDISDVPDGAWFIHGAISDASTTHIDTAPGRVVIDRTAPAVWATPPGGSYGQPQRVTLTASESATIHYTLDGTGPTRLSPAWTEPIAVDGSTTLRFLAVDAAGNVSDVSSETYTILPGKALDHFAFDVPSTVDAGLGFPLTLRALSREGALVEAFDGSVALDASTGTIAPSLLEGFHRGAWVGEAVLAGAPGPVTLTASWNGIAGTSAPILVECRAPQAPILDLPRDGARPAPESLSLAWHLVPGATAYGIQLSDDPRFTRLLWSQDGIPDTSTSPPGDLVETLQPGRTIFWRARAGSACGPGPWSESRRFALLRPARASLEILSPREGEILTDGTQHTLRWQSTGKAGSSVAATLLIPGRRPTLLAAGVPMDSGALAWTVPAGSHQRCRILIQSEQLPRVRARSGPFSTR